MVHFLIVSDDRMAFLLIKYGLCLQNVILHRVHSISFVRTPAISHITVPFFFHNILASTMSQLPHYIVLRVPVVSPRINELVAKFRETRLAAIKADPPSSWVTYEIEVEHPEPVWHARLYGGMACLVCIANVDPTLPTEDALLSGDWVGYVFVKERVAFEEYYAFPDMRQVVPANPELETRMHIFDLFILPDHRARGVGAKIVEGLSAAVRDALRLDDSGVKRARIRVMGNLKKEWLLHWYRSFGFMDRGTATRMQGFLSNGWGASIPEDTTSTEELRTTWHSPVGRVMELVIDVD